MSFVKKIEQGLAKVGVIRHPEDAYAHLLRFRDNRKLYREQVGDMADMTLEEMQAKRAARSSPQGQGR